MEVKFCCLFACITFSSLFFLNAQKNIDVNLESFDDDELSILKVFPDSFPTVSIVFRAEKDGEPVWDISSEQLSVIEDDDLCDIISIQPISKQESIKIAIVLDHSGSMMEEGFLNWDIDWENYIPPIENAKSAVKNFITSFNTNKDFISLIGFSTEVDIQVPLTQDTIYLNSIVDTIQANFATAMYDAIGVSIQQLKREKGIKVVIILTDGHDNVSENTREEVIERAKQEKIPLYVVGLGDVNLDTLKSIAAETDGDFFYTKNSSALDSIYEVISEKIQAFYDLKYRSSNLASIDATRQIRLEYRANSGRVNVDSTYTMLPASVIEHLKEKEKRIANVKKYSLLGGIVILTVLLGRVLYAKYQKQEDQHLKALAIKKVYPNPSSGIVNIMHNAMEGIIIIMNMEGTVTKTIPVTPIKNTIDLSNLQGVHLIQIQSQEQRSNVKQILLK